VSVEATGSVKEFFDVLSLEGKDLYEPFLAGRQLSDINISKWERSPQNTFVEGWSKEMFQLKRKTRYSMVYAGPEKNEPKRLQCDQEHFCRMDEAASKCIFAVKLWTEGHWFSDLFEIHVRWVIAARPVPNKVSIKVGLFVPILRHSPSAGKVFADATRDMSRHQLALLGVVLSRVVNAGSVQQFDQVNHAQHHSICEKDAAGNISCCLTPWQHQVGDIRILPGSLIACDDELVQQVHLLEQKLRAVETVLKKDCSYTDGHEECANFYLSELVIVREALESLTIWSESRDTKQNLHRLHFSEVMKQML